MATIDDLANALGWTPSGVTKLDLISQGVDLLDETVRQWKERHEVDMQSFAEFVQEFRRRQKQERKRQQQYHNTQMAYFAAQKTYFEAQTKQYQELQSKVDVLYRSTLAMACLCLVVMVVAIAYWLMSK